MHLKNESIVKQKSLKTKGYKYAHLGTVKLGLGSLVRRYMNVSSLCCVLDTHHLDFVDALIGGFEGPLHNGPFFGTIFPKYFKRLSSMFSPCFCKDVTKMLDYGCGYHNRGHFGRDSCSCKKKK